MTQTVIVTHARRDDIREYLLGAARNIRRAISAARDLSAMSDREDLAALAGQLRALEICLVYADETLSAVKCEAL